MNNNMNNLGSHTTPRRTFDFSRPPPGYSMPPSDASRLYRAPQANSGNSRVTYPAGLKKDTDYARLEVSSSDEPRASYSRSLAVARNVSPHVSRTSNVDSIGQSPRGVPTLTPPETPGSLDPRTFNLPPPLLPADPYAFNIAVPPGGYILSSTVYAFPGPPPPPAQPPPPPPPPAPPAAPMMGAGHYATQQPGNFRHHQQFPGDYSPGYPKRNAVNNQLNRKRTVPQEFQSESSPKRTPTSASKKKKKPLSQNMPAKKEWSLEEARRALDVERECNKRNNRPSLIIKFPDLELNRDIVSKFHPKIESVHFQKPSTQRYCFVTLKDSACMEEVISEINKVKFGQGYLSAELKHNKDDDMVKGPEDIDPLTLYVGNLAQEVTVDDVVRAYPKHKRIDIGFAKKMKYTRYAFVCFRTVDDAIDAFQNTHATEMYHQSLIVRFRRLHGTVGMPGDPKPQNPPRQKDRSESSDILPLEEDVVAEVANLHNPDAVITKREPEWETPEFTATNLFGEARVKSEPFDAGSLWDFPGDDYLEGRTHVPIYKVKDDPDNVIVKQEAPSEDFSTRFARVGNGGDSSEDECIISSTSFE